jgi:hypothetical protein
MADAAEQTDGRVCGQDGDDDERDFRKFLSGSWKEMPASPPCFSGGLSLGREIPFLEFFSQVIQFVLGDVLPDVAAVQTDV